MKPTTGATPLAALDAVAVDTETTGLDPAGAHIVQIGACILRLGAIERSAPLDRLVNPGIGIPPSATAIHGIDDDAVRDAPGFAQVWPEFLGFCGERIMIGHSIGFDLAIMQRETERHGLAFERPRSLCVRLLATVANPTLPDYSLDTIASWLGVAIAGRHSALGDANAAAEVFLALVPQLARRGVRTLAEAERASLALTGELERQHLAGWTQPVSRPAAPAYGAVDPFAYQHRVEQLMASPPVVVSESMTAAEVVRLLADRRIGSVFVSADGKPGGPVAAYGIVTERDMMRRIAAGGSDALSAAVGSFASRPLAAVQAAAFVYRAIGRMDRLKIRHLGVADEAGRLVGALSARDLLRLRAAAAIRLDDAIDEATTTAEMAAAWATLPTVARALIGETIDARSVAEIVSDELCAMTRRAAILGEEEMVREGLGAAPCPYCVLVLGSGGRGESLLAADQDNAIVFESGAPDGVEDRWFAALGDKIAARLDAAGIPYCKGGVMAKNPGFRGSLATWQERIDEWVGRSRPEDLLNVDIVFDMRPVHGEAALGSALFARAYARGSAEAGFAKLLGEKLDASASPFTFFGRFQLEAGRLDLKRHGLFPIVTAARALAIRHGLAERSTKARLEGLLALGKGAGSDLRMLLDGHVFLIGLMLAQQSADLHAGIPVSNRVETGRLASEEQSRLHALLRSLQAVPTLVRDMMFGD